MSPRKHSKLAIATEAFIKNYAAYVDEGRAALFVGAGLSRAAGFVDWRGLVKPLAQELGLDIANETDFVSLAQYYLNVKNNRSRLNELLVHGFSKGAVPTTNHSLIARLPIRSIWTTNYDHVLEHAFSNAGRPLDVKRVDEDFAISRGPDVALYKMHGDVDNPSTTILTRDDYERYEQTHPVFFQHLHLDLLTKHFLFLGFSFTDPNLAYILSAARLVLKDNGPEHFAIIRRDRHNSKSALRRADLWSEDLKRFNIEAIFVEDYADIEYVLARLSLRVHRKNIFVSGSVRAPTKPIPVPAPIDEISRTLGSRLILAGFNVVSGFGLGVGEGVVSGALRALHFVNSISDRVTVRPFPGHLADHEQLATNTQIRGDLIARSSTIVFIGGAHYDRGTATPSKGVLEEFAIATTLKRTIIPIGATGHAAAEIWTAVDREFTRYFPHATAKWRRDFDKLNDSSLNANELVDVVLRMLKVSTAQ